MVVLASTLVLGLAACRRTSPLATRACQAPTLSTPRGSSTTAAGNAAVNEVSVDLVVHTKHHKPICNLQSSQLAVTDDGSPVRLSSLRVVDPASGSQHLVTFVFDRLNPTAAKSARRMAEKILEIIPGKGYSLAVLEVNGRLHLLQPYSPNPHLVEAAMLDATPATPIPPSAALTRAEKTVIASGHSDALALSSADRAEGKMLLSALEQSQRILEQRRSYPSLAALQALVDSQRRLTGRKFIFYFASGIPSNSDARPILHSIVESANRDGVTINVVDTSPFNPKMNSALQGAVAASILGESGGFGSGISGAGAAGGAGGFSPGGVMNDVHVKDIAGFQFGYMDAGQKPLVALASGTGGVYIGASTGSKRQLRQVREDLTNWYRASWVPPIKNYDGQFRPIHIRSLRKGLVVRARSGYFAVPPAESAEIHPFEMPLLNILSRPALPTDIAFHAEILHLGALPDGNAAELAVQVPISQLEVHQDNNTHISSVHATIVAVIKNSKGAVLQRFGQDFPLQEAPDMLRGDSGQTITLQRQFSAAPGVYTLETAVMDRLANKAGAQRTTFTIKPPAPGPALSDIALVQSVEPTEEDNQTFQPMRYRNGRIIPNLYTDLPQDTRSLSLFFLIHPVAGSQSQPTLHLQIFRNHQLFTEMPMDPKKVSGTGAAIPYLATIHGDAFPPGAYQLKALLNQGGGTASSSVSFRIEGGAVASNSPSSSLAGGSFVSSDAPDSHLISEASITNSRFVVTSPSNPVPPPTDAEVQAMIEATRQRALAWSNNLVNFVCLEMTNHFVDTTGQGDWKHKGTLVELLKDLNHEESRKTLLLNGERSTVQPDRLQFAHSTGEFGGMFHVIFDPSAKAVFTWKRSGFVDGEPVQVFAFRVARANSRFSLFDRVGEVGAVGFHGLLYLEPATDSVRRIDLDADDIPARLLIRACSMSIDYSWITMQNHNFLLPVRGAVSMQETKKSPVLNEFEFRNYHRYGSHVRILTSDDLKALSKN